MKWEIFKIFNFQHDKLWAEGYAHFGFHDFKGNFLAISYDNNWVGQIGKNDGFDWVIGSEDPGISNLFIKAEIEKPHYATRSSDNSILIASNGTNKILKFYPDSLNVATFMDGDKFNIDNLGNCVLDKNDNIWVNDFTGCKILQFDRNGNHLLTLGNGIPGFQSFHVSFEQAQFNWAYDLRLGPDGNIYVLDSKNFAVRKIDLIEKKVSCIAGNGRSGYDGDKRLAINATMGSNPEAKFDGPLSMSLDEEGNVYIGDTANHVVRMVDIKTQIISTIAGSYNNCQSIRNNPNESDPLKLNLPMICSLEYYNGMLFIPEWDGDLVILKKCND